ncbi:MAG: hypothetical protein WD509_03355 [Candidatus Paceibacterota bacterium]
MRTFLLIIHAFKDLATRFLPKKKTEASFAFLIHPRDIHDVLQKYPFLKIFPAQTVEYLLTHFFWPITASRITGTKRKDGTEVFGWMISIPMTASEMLNGRDCARKHIQRAYNLAVKKGATHIGLGALTASLTRGGLDIKPAPGVTLTNGKLYTAKTVTDITLKSSEVFGIDKSTTRVAIVGAAGSIGSASAQILAHAGFKNFQLIDLSDREVRVKEIATILSKLGGGVSVDICTNLERLIEADIIITATNRPDALVKTEHLKPGAIVVDDAQPSDIDPELFKTRNDVLLLEGGVVHADTIQLNFKTGLKHRTDIFSCLAEAVILFLAGETDSRIGEVVEVDFDSLKKLTYYSDNAGFTSGDFQNAYKIYTQEDIDFVKQARII